MFFICLLLLCGLHCHAFNMQKINYQLKVNNQIHTLRSAPLAMTTDPSESTPSTSAISIQPTEPKPTGFFGKLKSKLPFINKKTSNTDTSDNEKKEKFNIKELGIYALLSYGFVSNFSYVTTVICAWVIHGKSSGKCVCVFVFVCVCNSRDDV